MASPGMALPPGAKLVDQSQGMTLPPGAKLVTAAPQERSFSEAVANAGEKFWDWTGKPVAMALGLSGGTDAERGAKAREAQKQIVGGIMNEPARVRQELTNALDAFVAGNPRATMHHVLTAVPVVGEGINQAAQEFNSGDTSSGVGHMLAITSPAIAKELPAVAAGARAVGSAAKEVLGSLVPERTPTPEGTPVNPMLHRVARYAAGKVVPGGGLAYDVLKDVLEKKAAEAAPVAAEPMTPGRILVEQSNGDWSKMAPQDRAMMETVARAQANAAAQPPRPPMGPPQAPAAAPVEEAPAAPAEVIGAHQVTPLQSGRPMPLRPPIRTAAPAEAAPEAPQSAPLVAPTSQAPTAVPPSRMSLAEVEADMANQPDPNVEPPRSQFTAAGDPKSPQLRATEITAGNRAAKVGRIAQELHEAVAKAGGNAYEQMSRMPKAELEKTLSAVADLLGEGDLSDVSRPQLMFELNRLSRERLAISNNPKALEAAQALKNEMEGKGEPSPEETVQRHESWDPNYKDKFNEQQAERTRIALEESIKGQIERARSSGEIYGGGDSGASSTLSAEEWFTRHITGSHSRLGNSLWKQYSPEQQARVKAAFMEEFHRPAKTN